MRLHSWFRALKMSGPELGVAGRIGRVAFQTHAPLALLGNVKIVFVKLKSLFTFINSLMFN